MLEAVRQAQHTLNQLVICACADRFFVSLTLISQDGLMKDLEQQQGQLEICEKALADYMESKRRIFPRFYFVSTAGVCCVSLCLYLCACVQALSMRAFDGLFRRLCTC